MNSTAQQGIAYSAMALNATQKEHLALSPLCGNLSISSLAKANALSRQILHRQKNKALEGIKAVFRAPQASPENILFTLPVTTHWLRQFIISLALDCKGSYRGILSVLENCFDHTLCLWVPFIISSKTRRTKPIACTKKKI